VRLPVETRVRILLVIVLTASACAFGVVHLAGEDLSTVEVTEAVSSLRDLVSLVNRSKARRVQVSRTLQAKNLYVTPGKYNAQALLALVGTAYPAHVRHVGGIDFLVPLPTSASGSVQDYQGITGVTLQRLSKSNLLRISRGWKLRHYGIPFDADQFDGKSSFALTAADKLCKLFIVARFLSAREMREEITAMQKQINSASPPVAVRDLWRGGWDGNVDGDHIKQAAGRMSDEEVDSALQELGLSRVNVVFDLPVFTFFLTEWKPAARFGSDVFEPVTQQMVEIPLRNPD